MDKQTLFTDEELEEISLFASDQAARQVHPGWQYDYWNLHQSADTLLAYRRSVLLSPAEVK